MNIQMIKSKDNCYKIIANIRGHHPALVELAQLCAGNNKYSNTKVGVYNVYGGFISNKISVYSYISNKRERMNKRQYNKFLSGKKQIVQERVEVLPIPQEEDIAK